MSQPTQFEIVGSYLANCRPPVDASTSQVSAVIQAWNEIVAKASPGPAAEPAAKG